MRGERAALRRRSSRAWVARRICRRRLRAGAPGAAAPRRAVTATPAASRSRGRRPRRRGGRRSARRAAGGARRACSCGAARADERDGLAGRELEVDGVENRCLAGRVAEGDAFEPHRRRAEIGRVAAAAGDAGRRLDQVEERSGDRGAVGARVELRREVAEGEVELGGEDQHRQPGSRPRSRSTSRTPTVTATSATPIVAASEHRSGEEGDAECPQRGSAVAVADGGKLLALRAAPVEGAQGRQASDDIEEMRRQQRERLPALARPAFGVAADEPHEDGPSGRVSSMIPAEVGSITAARMRSRRRVPPPRGRRGSGRSERSSRTRPTPRSTIVEPATPREGARPVPSGGQRARAVARRGSGRQRAGRRPRSPRK